MNLATPPLSVPVPMTVAPSSNTVPVGVPLPGLTAAIVAVKVRLWPNLAVVVVLLVRAVVVADWVTVWLRAPTWCR